MPVENRCDGSQGAAEWRDWAKPVKAVHHIRAMRGKTHAQLVRAGDGLLYVVKFHPNACGVRTLAHEALGTLLARHVGLETPEPVVIAVSDWLVQHTPELRSERHGMQYRSGLHFGSRHILNGATGHVLDWFPDALLPRLSNPLNLAGGLAFDLWTGNQDYRQAVFYRFSGSRQYFSALIDFAACLAELKFAGRPAPWPVHLGREAGVFHLITGWPSWEPWLSRMEVVKEQEILELANSIPSIWYGGVWQSMQGLAARLVKRQSGLRAHIAQEKERFPIAFPNWRLDS